uniref:Uncharacterized protein n=1 Tax=Anguilla anguilla TaxID=7936 RepID=A0A0E9U3T6_ANGAN
MFIKACKETDILNHVSHISTPRVQYGITDIASTVEFQGLLVIIFSPT